MRTIKLLIELEFISNEPVLPTAIQMGVDPKEVARLVHEINKAIRSRGFTADPKLIQNSYQVIAATEI